MHSPGTYKNFRAVIDALPNTLTGQVICGRLVVMPRPAPPHLHAASALDRQIGRRFGDGEIYRPAGTWRGDARVRVEPFDAAELDLARLWVPAR